MNFANYSRKSVFSDKSDSVDNQRRMAMEYAQMHFPGQVDTFTCYSDEDFTGANTNRPDLQRLLSDINAGMIDVLIVYQLDRLSRDVKDFANIYSGLEEKHVQFISIKENIDTTTPIGKAMMYVTVVFAQMERETIASRVTDNMTGLARKGYWVAGNPPHGYVRQSIVVDGRKHVTIVPDPDGVAFVNKVFDLFLDNNFSLQSMETYCRHKGIRTPDGYLFTTNQIHKILTMPYCVEAVPEIYDFYAAKGCIMDPDSPREKWDGSHGVLIYGRTTQKSKKHVLQPPEKWRVCLGWHEPFMSAETWLAAQARLSRNKFEKVQKYDIPILKGSLRCSCGALMQVSRRKKVDGSVSSWYYCLNHSRKGKDVCPRSQININILDDKVLAVFRDIEQDHSLIRKYASALSDQAPRSDPGMIDKQISATESRIRRLASSLALHDDSSAAKYIIDEIERLDSDLAALKQQRLAASAAERQQRIIDKSLDERADEIANLIKNFDVFTPAERNAIARNVLSRCEWDGETLFLAF